MASRYAIAEWFGRTPASLSPAERQRLAEIALADEVAALPCPFKRTGAACHKKGGVCSMRPHSEADPGRLGPATGAPVIMCPSRFEQENTIVRWLADIVGFGHDEWQVAREVPFMKSSATSRAAGKIDLVVAWEKDGAISFFGLEIQAVYFSGHKMALEFEHLRSSNAPTLPFPVEKRRPDFRSSSAKRLMPQLQVKVPTLRRWGAKLAVCVDRPFFDAIGGPSQPAEQDLNAGDVIWMAPELVEDSQGSYVLRRGHWEVLTLEDSSEKLLAARTISRAEFETTLRAKLAALRG